ncbi:MAG: preprotein translocase subunit SecG [Planctomycetaceae bacterium]|nr:preprotein translocase subunit SecG [Planctomycetaceae bacterium]
MATFLILLLILLGLFLMLIILIQKGRGGGLAGAFGGAGGQSAFGTKAGDVFTRITVAVATVWIILAAITGMVISGGSNKQGDQFPKQSTEVSAGIGDEGSTDAGSGEMTLSPSDFQSELTVPSTTTTEEPASENSESEPAEPTSTESETSETPPAEPEPSESTTTPPEQQ